MKYDLVAIGDITTDCFIKLGDPNAHCDIDHGTRELCVEFGAKVQYESATVVPAVGNSANAAVCGAKLGLRSALVTNQGDDDIAKIQRDALANAGVALDFVKDHSGAKTNYHYVLWYGSERTILIKHEPFARELPDIGEPTWLYVTSVGDETGAFHDRITDYLDAHPSVRLALQPGIEIKIGKERLARLYRRAEVVMCNLEEAQRILDVRSPTSDMKTLIAGMHALGPKKVIVTDGRNGAYYLDGAGLWLMPLYPDPRAPYERTGAGDAFSATFVSALALGKEPLEALRWAPINSMSVVQKVGAQAGLLTRAEIEKYLSEAPADYLPSKI